MDSVRARLAELAKQFIDAVLVAMERLPLGDLADDVALESDSISTASNASTGRSKASRQSARQAGKGQPGGAARSREPIGKRGTDHRRSTRGQGDEGPLTTRSTGGARLGRTAQRTRKDLLDPGWVDPRQLSFDFGARSSSGGAQLSILYPPFENGSNPAAQLGQAPKSVRSAARQDNDQAPKSFGSGQPQEAPLEPNPPAAQEPAPEVASAAAKTERALEDALESAPVTERSTSTTGGVESDQPG